MIIEKQKEAKEKKINIAGNPFCESCKEKDCCVSLDGTCAMIREYLKAVKGGNKENDNGRIVRSTGTKPYRVKPSPTGDTIHLVVDHGPIETCVAIVCNVEWAKRIRDILNLYISRYGSVNCMLANLHG